MRFRIDSGKVRLFEATHNATKSSSGLGKTPFLVEDRRFDWSFRRFKLKSGVFLATVDVFGFGGAHGNLELGVSLCCFASAPFAFLATVDAFGFGRARGNPQFGASLCSSHRRPSPIGFGGDVTPGGPRLAAAGGPPHPPRKCETFPGKVTAGT